MPPTAAFGNTLMKVRVWLEREYEEPVTTTPLTVHWLIAGELGIVGSYV
jgi:hypothetical protein